MTRRSALTWCLLPALAAGLAVFPNASGRSADHPDPARPAVPAAPGGHAPKGGHAGPHADDAAHGHAMLFEKMMPADAADFKAAASGRWSAAATWAGGKVPAPGGRVLIPKGVTVTVDREFPDALFWVRVDGVLKFDPAAKTLLAADTVAVAPGGRFEMGTAADPVKADATAELVIRARDGKPIDHARDPLELGRGLLAQGAVVTHGTEKTPFVALSAVPKAGGATIDLDAAPQGWRAGDELVLTATAYDQDETFRLVSVEGKRVTLDKPIRHERVLPKDAAGKPFEGLALHLGNLTRNVRVRSAAAGDLKLQGHVMLMHGSDYHLAWTGFHDLGRTTVKPVTDPRVVHGKRDPGTNPLGGISEENVRGRYALHFHRAGPTPRPATVLGCALTAKRGTGLKIGVVNHSSNVSVRDCVSHNFDGSHYFTEEGDEVGDFTGNLAVHSVGSGVSHDEQPRDRVLMQDRELYHRRRLDVGHRGTGFWLNGGGVDVVNNVSAGQAHSGFHIWPRALNFRLDNTYPVRFPTASLKDPSWVPGKDMDAADVPIKFTGNVAYVLATTRHRGVAGFAIDYFGQHTRPRYPKLPYSQVSDLLSWNAGGLRTTYTGNLHIKNVRIIAGTAGPGGVGIGLRTQNGNSDIVEGVRVEGFATGIIAPARGVIRGGTFTTGTGLFLVGGQGTVVDLAGMQFVEPQRGDRPATPRPTAYALYRAPIFQADGGFNPSVVFAPQSVPVRGHPDFPNGAELYSVEQMPDYVLPDLGVPGLLDGKTTTAQAWAKYRLAPGGAVAPRGAGSLAGVPTNGAFGPPARYEAALAYREASPAPGRHQPQVQLRGVAKDKAGVEVAAVDLKAGWNLVPVQAGGAARTLVIHGGPVPRRPQVEAGPDATVSAADGTALSGSAGTGTKLRWSRAYGPGAVTFEDESAARTRARFEKTGVYVLHLTAKDAAGGTNTDSVVVTVEVDRP